MFIATMFLRTIFNLQSVMFP